MTDQSRQIERQFRFNYKFIFRSFNRKYIDILMVKFISVFCLFILKEKIIIVYQNYIFIYLGESLPQVFDEGETGFLWSWNFMISKVCFRNRRRSKEGG